MGAPFHMLVLSFIGSCVLPLALIAEDSKRPRSRDVGIIVGEFPAGPDDAITDVPGVRVGHVTLIQGDSIRTGVTAILPHGGDIFREKVPAAFECFNGFGKAFGTVQIQELGVIETPILLGGTLCVPRIADAVMGYVIAQDRGGQIVSINPAVGETNDGFLSDGRSRPVKAEHVIAAIAGAKGGPVAEGSVGAGTGTRCFGWKGGIGTASRCVNEPEKKWTVGVLVQTNFGGKLDIAGRAIPNPAAKPPDKGSCCIVVATDAPLDARQLKRLARRSFAGMARTGASFSHGSGDYAFAFSTAWVKQKTTMPLDEELLSPLFIAVADATQEAIYNSLLRATSVTGREGHKAEALPLDAVEKSRR